MNGSMENDLAVRVHAIRDARGWTQDQFAREAGVSLRTYQAFESGQSKPQAAKLRGILRAAGLDGEGEETATGSRSEWPAETAVFLDMLGAYLNTMADAQRLEVIHDLTRQIFEANRAAQTRQD